MRFEYEISVASKLKNVETYFLQAVGPSYPIPPPKHALVEALVIAVRNVH